MRRLLVFALGFMVSGLLVDVSNVIAKETDGDVPLTGISASLQPDLFTGTLTGSIPIEVPPGRNGMQPNLALAYESAGGNGWVGMGWKLEMGTIERQTRWGVLYTPTPAEEQAGKVYTIRLNGVSTDLVQDATDQSLYHEKVKSGFLRIKKLSPNGWEVTDTKGTKYTFGTGARIEGTVGSLGTQVFKWCLEEVRDRDGNFMKMTYTPIQGQGYLSQIDYTGKGTGVGPDAPSNTVKFYLEDRTDKPVMYTSYFPITTTKLLRTIEVKANGTPVRAYKFGYTTSSSTLRSLLTSVQQFGKDATVDSFGVVTGGTPFPPITTHYRESANNFDAPLPWAQHGGPFWAGQEQYADVNGDGMTDMIFQGQDNKFWVSLSVGAASTTPVMWVQHGGTFQAGQAQYADVDGDGMADLIFQGLDNRFWISLSTGTGFSTPNMALDYGGVFQAGKAFYADWNGDGKSDLLMYEGQIGQFYVALSIGQVFNNLGSWLSVPGWVGTPLPIFSGDFNGDGKSDLLIKAYQTGQLYVATSTGSTFNLASWLHNTNVIPHDYPFTGGDFNGDGKSDVLISEGAGVFYVATSTGSSFSLAIWHPAVAGWADGTGQYPFASGDFNGDGKTDVLIHAYASGQFYVATSTGSNFTLAGWLVVPGWVGATFPIVASDFTGDGKTDVMLREPSNYFRVLVSSGLLPDLEDQMANGLGGTTAITYLPSTRPQFQNAPGALPYPIHTVSSLTTTDGNGNSSISTYSYTKGYHQIGDRDFRGFKTAAVTSPGASDADKTVTTTLFHQGNGDTENPRVANGYMKGKPYQTEVKRKSDNLLYTKTETTYLGDQIGTDATAPWFTPPTLVTTSLYDNAGVLAKQTQTEAVSYDAYGNLTLSYNRGDSTGNNAITSDDITTAVMYAPPDTTNWLIGFPTVQSTYAGLGPSGVKLSETKSYYDGTGTGACTAAPTGSNTTVTKGKLTKVERWLSGGTNPISGMEYDPTTGVLLCTRDPLGNKTTKTYDPTKTFVLSTTNQLGHVTTTVYSGVNGVAIDPATGFYGKVKSVTDPNGKVVSHEYDALGRKIKTTAPDGLVTTVTYPTLAEFGQIGTQKITTTTSGAFLPAALTSSTFFDGLGRTFKKESSGPNGAMLVNEMEYDVRGQVFRTSLPYFKATESLMNRWRTMTYDALGRVTQVTHSDTLSGTALTSKSCYAPFVTVTLDPSGARKRSTTDAYGRVVKIEEYSTTTSTCDTSVGTPYATTNYTYDLLGNLTKVVDTLGNRTTMRYDTLSRKLALSDPDMSTNGTVTCGDLTTLTPNTAYPWYAAPCWNYQYDAAGNLTRQTDAKTQHLWFRYDGLNRRSQKDYTTQKAAGSGDVRYVYDDTVTTFNRKGRLRQMIDAATNVTFEYDTMGRITKSTRVLDGTTYVTTSVYDGLGRLKEVTYPGATPKTVEYLYTGPALERVRDKSGSGMTIYAIYSNYTSQGQAQTITYGNGVVTTSTFADPAHSACVPANSFKLCTLKTQKGTTPAYQDLTYTFTADGNMDLITDPINGNQDFGYDGLDRLTSAIYPTATFTYTYNQIGNMLTNTWLTAGTYTYPVSGAGVVRPHAVQTAGPYSYSYDNNGNQTGITSTTGDFGSSTTFNVDNRLASAVSTFGSTTVNTSFVYDGDGGRVKKIVGTTTTRYISKLYECDTTGTTNSCSRFIWANDTRIATVAVTNGTVHYWHGDHLGSSSVITNSTGAKVQALTYTPYGGVFTNQSFTTPAINVPYKYTGKEFDASTDFYYYESRYYDPSFGRFISPDTIVPDLYDPQDLNRYTYAGNNPLKYTDPTGHRKCALGICLSKSDTQTLITVGAFIGSSVTSYLTANLVSQAIVNTLGFSKGALSAAGQIGGGIVGGAVGGGLYEGAQGHSLSRAFLGAGYGALSGGVFAGVGAATINSDIFVRASLTSLTGGILSVIKGGKFDHGWLASVINSGLMAGWEAARDWTNASSFAAGNRNDCGGIIGLCTAGARETEGNMRRTGFWGGLASLGDSSSEQYSRYWAPIQAVSKVHDWIGGSLFGTYNASGRFVPFDGGGPADAAYNIFGNWGTMIPAAAYTGAAFLGAGDLAVDIANP